MTERISMPKIDLNPYEWEEVSRILLAHVPEYDVWAFGSRVKWTAKQYSDLDLAIITEHPLSFSTAARLADAFDNSTLTVKVDVVDWASTSESFRKIIESQKVLVQTGQKALANWKFVRLIDCTSDGNLSYGIVQPGQHTAIGIPIVRVNNFDDTRLNLQNAMRVSPDIEAKHKRTRLLGGEVLLTLVGSVGQSVVAPSALAGWNVARAIAVIRPHPDVGADWLNICLQTKAVKQFLDERANTTVQKTLNLSDVKEVLIPIPPKETKREIEAIYMTLTNRIDLLRETNTTLESIAQALFKSWFVDFDPVYAMAEGREPEGIPSEIISLFPSEFENSELGEIPQGWRAMPLADACEINPTRRLTKGKQAPYLEMSALPTQGHRPETPISRAFSSGTKFINGDTLLARITPCLENGKTAFVDCLPEGEVGWGSTEYIVLRPKAPLPNYWAYLLSRHEHFRQFAIQAMVGTSGRQRVEVTRLAQYLVTVPDERVSVAFAEIVEPLQRRIAANDDSAKSLALLRDTLLPRLMSGKIKLEENNQHESSLS